MKFTQQLMDSLAHLSGATKGLRVIKCFDRRKIVKFVASGCTAKVYQDRQGFVYISSNTPTGIMSRDLLCQAVGLHPCIPDIEPLGPVKSKNSGEPVYWYKMPFYDECRVDMYCKEFKEAELEVRDILTKFLPQGFRLVTDPHSPNVRMDGEVMIFTDYFCVVQ